MKKFLVVDDDEIFLFTATFVLRKKYPNVEIITSRNGEEALEILSKENPDALFIDLNMPIMGGWEVLEKLDASKEVTSYPIVIVTSSIDPSDKKKAFTFEFQPKFVEKPLTEEKLIALGL